MKLLIVAAVAALSLAAAHIQNELGTNRKNFAARIGAKPKPI